jgi:[CysO sulfur-carrier protein]-S-L-cysteine hydrolase
MRLEFPASLRSRMRKNLIAAGRREIGGVLMGEQLAPGEFRLVDYSVDSTSGSGAHFVRRPEHHREALEAFFERTGDYSRFNYVGEWHSHPSFAAYPSRSDIEAMCRIVEDEPEIDFSVLLITRTRWRFKLECSALLFQRGGHVSEVHLA